MSLSAVGKITPHDILSLEEYQKIRPAYRQRISALKRRRRMAVGPDIMMYFENFDTLQFQIQEMLYIEKGGEEQLWGELEAYNPLLPQGSELVITLMIEIPDINHRENMLRILSHIEEKVFLKIGNALSVKALPVGDDERTAPDGKTSSVHFLKFPFLSTEVTAFKDLTTPVMIHIEHPYYNHVAPMPPEVRQSLTSDLRG